MHLARDQLSKSGAMARPPMTPGLLRVVVFGCVGMALIGYDTGVVSGSLVMMSKDMEMDNFRKDFAVSATILLAAVGSVMGIPINDRFGRRRSSLARDRGSPRRGRRARTAARRALHANGSLGWEGGAAASRGVGSLVRGLGRPGQGSGP